MADIIDIEIEKSIANQLIDAGERQPVRWDVYINHINYLDGRYIELKADMYRLKEKIVEFQCPNPWYRKLYAGLLSKLW